MLGLVFYFRRDVVRGGRRIGLGDPVVAARRVIALPTDAEQRQRLLAISRSRTEPTGRVERARIILAYLQDPSAYAVARTIGVTQQTVTRGLERAAELGVIEALDDRPRAGRDPVITPEAKTWLVALACRKAKELGYPHELWTTRLLAAHARQHGPSAGHPSLGKLAQGTVCKILAEQEVKPHKVRYYLEQRDPEFRAQDGRDPLRLPASGDAAGGRGEGSRRQRWREPRPRLLRRETRNPGDRDDRAGSPATAQHQPDRDARSRVQAPRHHEPDGRSRSARRSRPCPGQGTPPQSRIHRVSQPPRRRLPRRNRHRGDPRQPFRPSLARDHELAHGAAHCPVYLHVHADAWVMPQSHRARLLRAAS